MSERRLIPSLADRILAALRREGAAPAPVIAAALGARKASISSTMARLLREGRIKRTVGRARHFELAEEKS